MLELESLQSYIDHVWQWIEQTKIKARSIKQLPWFLVIGPSHVGKTQLILRSGLPASANQPFAVDGESDALKRCNWWLKEEALFLDLPGHYFENQGEDSGVGFQEVIQAIQRRAKRRFFQGILLTLDASQWASQNKTVQQQQIQQFKQALHFLTQHLKRACPVHLIVTKLDKIAGFSEFFSDLGQQERDKAWGFSIPKYSNLLTAFKTECEKLSEDLYKRVIFRLHQEHQPKKCVAVQQFPFQIELLKNNLSHFMGQLSDFLLSYSKVPLRDVHFVSSLQKDKPCNFVQQHLAQTLAVQGAWLEVTGTFMSGYQKIYFLPGFFKKLVTQYALSMRSLRSLPYLGQSITYLVCALLLVTGSVFMINRSGKDMQSINVAQHALTRYQLLAQQLPLGDTDLSQTLPALDALKQGVDALQKSRLSNRDYLAKQAYRRALTRYFLPGLTYLLEQTLTTEIDPYVLYNTLKIYLMLSQANHIDAHFISTWLNSYWRQTFYTNPWAEKQLNMHLAALLHNGFSPIAANQQIINRARTTLATVPVKQLAYAILKSENENKWINPFLEDESSVPGFKKIFSNITQIPGINRLYTSHAFATVYFQEVPRASSAAIHGNWILGKLARADNEQLLTKAVQVAYLQDYAKHWQTLLNSLILFHWQTLPDFIAALNTLSSKESPLVSLLNTVRRHTDLAQFSPLLIKGTASDVQTIKTYLSDPFHVLNRLLVYNSSLAARGINQTLFNLKRLRLYLTPTEKTDQAKFLFELTKKRFTDAAATDPTQVLLAQDSPWVLQSWLKALSDNAWTLVLDDTRHYLDQVWSTQVLSYYKQKIHNRYPVAKKSDSEISLRDFKTFFAADGVLDQYFNHYLAPFINASRPEWSFRTVNNLSLNLSRQLLTEFKRASVIRAMFFNANQQLSVDFTLRRVAFGPGVKRLAFIYNDQPYTDSANRLPETYHLHWPTQNNNVSLAFTSDENHVVSQTVKGSWALFRLLDRAQLQPVQDTRHFELLFDSNGYAARYQLVTTQLVNPFVAGIIDQFTCPEKI